MAELKDLRLTIESPALFIGAFQFRVLRRQHEQGSPFALVTTGTEASLADAMRAAEWAAAAMALFEDSEP